jgi:hypothetical protein
MGFVLPFSSYFGAKDSKMPLRYKVGGRSVLKGQTRVAGSAVAPEVLLKH